MWRRGQEPAGKPKCDLGSRAVTVFFLKGYGILDTLEKQAGNKFLEIFTYTKFVIATSLDESEGRGRIYEEGNQSIW